MGITKREIASELGVSKRTIANYIGKLGLGNHVSRNGNTDILDDFAAAAIADALKNPEKPSRQPAAAPAPDSRMPVAAPHPFEEPLLLLAVAVPRTGFLVLVDALIRHARAYQGLDLAA